MQVISKLAYLINHYRYSNWKFSLKFSSKVKSQVEEREIYEVSPNLLLSEYSSLFYVSISLSVLEAYSSLRGSLSTMNTISLLPWLASFEDQLQFHQIYMMDTNRSNGVRLSSMIFCNLGHAPSLYSWYYFTIFLNVICFIFRTFLIC